MYIRTGISSSGYYGGLGSYWLGAADPQNYIPRQNTKLTTDGASNFFHKLIKVSSFRNQNPYPHYNIYWNAFGPLASKKSLLFKKPHRVKPS